MFYGSDFRVHQANRPATDFGNRFAKRHLTARDAGDLDGSGGLEGIMTTVTALEPSQREILVNLGNRYAVFGPSMRLPRPVHFNPDADSEILPRVADESGIADERIAQTLRVFGMKRTAPADGNLNADIELVGDDGNLVLIDIKVRERDPKNRDFNQAVQRLTEAADRGRRLEVWYFNIERLKLVIMRFAQSGLQIDELDPLDV